jgi:glutamate N-acetyltransferase/amino-acid N-acetyltransferase
MGDDAMATESAKTQGDLEIITTGSVTTPRGFTAGATKVGVRSDWDKLDVGIVASEAQCIAAAVYTQNNLKGASLVISMEHLKNGRVQAIVANSGCANCSVGQQGFDDAITMAQLTGEKLGIDPHDVIVASTGVIGTMLPMDRISKGITDIELSSEGGIDFARAIMTTDTKEKHIAIRAGDWSIGGVVKGVGMIHPNMATMLCFVTTDAPVEQAFLARSLKGAVDDSFNMIDVDSDTSPDDIVAVLSNGLAGGTPIDDGHADADRFRSALSLVCVTLARKMVADAEGATKVIEARVRGASSDDDARAAARAIISSVGVKTAVYGHDPNWGRIVSAVGNSGAPMDESRMSLEVSDGAGKSVLLFREGAPVAYDEAEARSCFAHDEVTFAVDMGSGTGEAVAWGSDLTDEFVRLNSQYTT